MAWVSIVRKQSGHIESYVLSVFSDEEIAHALSSLRMRTFLSKVGEHTPSYRPSDTSISVARPITGNARTKQSEGIAGTC
jgi:hypothetical protein